MYKIHDFLNFLLESKSSEDLGCGFYKNKSKDSQFSNFWKEYNELSQSEKQSKRDEIVSFMTKEMESIVQEYREWFENPSTKAKFKPDEDAVRRSLLNYLDKIKLKPNFTPNQNSSQPGAWGYCFPTKIETPVVYVNVYNFYNGKPTGNKSVRDTIKHELAHMIDGYFAKKGVRTYNATHPQILSPEEYERIYLINDMDQFARLNVFRTLIGAGPVDSADLLLSKFLNKVKKEEITSKIFSFRGIKSKGDEKYYLVMEPKSQPGVKGKVSLEDAKEAFKLMSGKGAVMNDGKENPNVEQLFSNFATIKNGRIYINMSDIASLNSTAKGLKLQ